MTLAGSLRQATLPEVLRSIESGQRTGRLIIERGPLRADLYFAGGQWLTLERIGDTAPLAYRLARASLINPQQFQMAAGIPLAQAGMMPDMQAVRMLISARVLTQDQLRLWFQNDAISLLTVILAWDDGDFHFEEGTPPPAGRVSLPLPVTPLLGQAMQTLRGGIPVREVAPLAPDTVIDFTEIDPAITGAVRLSREQWRMLTMVDGQMPLRGIAQNLQAPEPIILRLASELAAQGIITAVGPAEPFA